MGVLDFKQVRIYWSAAHSSSLPLYWQLAWKANAYRTFVLSAVCSSKKKPNSVSMNVHNIYKYTIKHKNTCLELIHLCKFIYRTRRNFRGGLIFVLFAGEVDPRKLMRTKIKNYGPSP